MIYVNNVSKSYGESINDKPVINQVNVSLPNTGMCFILGKSGSGKSTFLNMLGGIISEYEGSIEIDSVDITRNSENDWDVFRNKYYGIVFQDFNLIENFTVYDNLLLPLNIVKRDKSEIDKEIDTVLSCVGLTEYKKQKVSHLSGGQKQRIAIARALVKKPKIILADEPTGNLDSKTSKEIFQLLKKISKECLVIVATHDVDAAYEYADVILEISDGNVEQVNFNKKVYQCILKNEGKEVIVKENSYNTIRSEIVEFVKRHLSNLKTDSFDISIKVDVKQEELESKSICQEERENRAASNEEMPLGFKKALLYAITNIKNKKIKNLFILSLLAIMVMFIFFATNLNEYDSARVLNKYNEKYKPDFLTVSKLYEYTDSFFDVQAFELSSGQVFFSTLCDVFDEDKIYPVVRENWFSYEDMYIENIRIMVIPEKEENHQLLISGHFPENSNEIVITDYLAKKLGIDYEKSENYLLVNDQDNLKIVGILRTDYIEYGIFDKINSSNINEYAEYKIYNEYQVAMVSQKYIDIQKNNALTVELPRSNILYSQWESRLLSSSMIYGSEEVIGQADLLAGELPKAWNEILISEELAMECDIDLEKFQYFESRFVNLNDEKYNNAYSDELNLSEIFPDGFKVVGVYGGINGEIMDFPHILLKKQVFDHVKEKYYETYIYDEYFILNDEYGYETFDCMNLYGVKWTDVSAQKIYMFDTILESLRIYINIVIFFLATGIGIICILLISYSIKDQAKLLGIMRSVGYTKYDLNKIFFVESVFIGVLSTLIAGILFYVVTYYCNYNYASDLKEYPFDILVFAPVYAMVISVGCIFICVISTIFPVYNLSKKKPFELIHGR